MEISKKMAVMIQTYEKGYRVNENGEVYYKGRKRSLTSDTKGYLTFTVRVKTDDGDVFRRVWVHQLQAYQKFGDQILKQGIQVRHLDGVSVNNARDNISIGSQSDNQLDRPKSDRVEHAIKASYVNRKFTDEEVDMILEDRRNGYTYKMLIEKYDTSKSTLSFLFNKSLYAQR